MTPSAVSVVICTHNPRRDYLDRALAALATQSLARDQWDLLLIDNASTQQLATHLDVSWHPCGRVIREETLGLTVARSRGITESGGRVILFVDDDNLLAPDFLEVALKIADKYPHLGSWGGVIEPEFEVPPPAWMKRHQGMLALRGADRDRWSNGFTDFAAVPMGAGLCVRRDIAQKWATIVSSNQKRRGLDRIGQHLGSAGDTDLALSACDEGFGTGVFIGLKLVHLISKGRLNLDYIERLAEGMAYSHGVLASLRPQDSAPASDSIFRRAWWQLRLLRMPVEERRIHWATARGRIRAQKELTASDRR